MVSVQIVVCSLIMATTSAQFAPSGICSTWTNGESQCYSANLGCPSGMILHPQLGLVPWSCGGWLSVCCTPDPFVTTTTTTTTTTTAPGTAPIDETDCGTGKPTSRILKGSNTSMCDWPYVAAIRMRIDNRATQLTQASTQYACAGVIIDKNWVLTHPICCYLGNRPLSQVSSSLVVVAGEYDTMAVDVDPRYQDGRAMEQFVPVSQCFVHPGYAQINTIINLPLDDPSLANGNGLALMKLAEPINNYCAATACLPFAEPLASQQCDTFDQCVILGWGFESTNFATTDGKLKQGFVKIYKDNVCDFLENSLFSGATRFSNSACQSADLGQDSCLGDQGGPVLCYDGDRWSVQGIIPFNLCADNRVSPYVVDVPYSDTWIYDTIRNNP